MTRQVVVIGRLRPRQEGDHLSIGRVIEVRSQDGESILHGRFLVPAGNHMKEITSLVVHKMLREIASMRKEPWKS